MMLKIIFAIAFISVIGYLAVFFRFAARFPKIYPELWSRLGCPETFGLRGQSKYLAVVLGQERNAPLHELQRVRREIVIIRVLLGFTLVAFILAALMTG